MRTLLISLLALLLVPVVARAQVNPPIPSNITQLGPIQFLGDDGSITFESRTVDGRVRLPAGIIAWSAAPFRYRAYFAQGDADTVSTLLAPVPVDTAYSDVRGDIKYPCVLVLPGAKWLSADVGDTLWARAYYID